MMTDAQAQRKRMYEEKKRNDKKNLIRSGTSFIKKFNQLLEETNATDAIQKKYMAKVLHAIFFFGWTHKPQVKPEEFLSVHLQASFQNRFPQPFAQYTTHLPTQTPYSILLDYVTEELGVADPDKVMNRLTAINADMYKLSAENNVRLTPSTFFFIASVVARSTHQGPQDTANNTVFFGASLACKGKAAKLIMIDLSCIKTWHGAVASAVLSPETGSATLFSDRVSCQAYQIKGNYYITRPPCERCHEIFKNVTFDPPFNGPQNAEWNYGNCAETEALSKLLWCYPDAATGQLTDTSREKTERSLISKLRSSSFLVSNPLQYFQAE